jgi:hypothetical protein
MREFKMIVVLNVERLAIDVKIVDKEDEVHFEKIIPDIGVLEVHQDFHHDMDREILAIVQKIPLITLQDLVLGQDLTLIVNIPNTHLGIFIRRIVREPPLPEEVYRTKENLLVDGHQEALQNRRPQGNNILTKRLITIQSLLALRRTLLEI